MKIAGRGTVEKDIHDLHDSSVLKVLFLIITYKFGFVMAMQRTAIGVNVTVPQNSQMENMKEITAILN